MTTKNPYRKLVSTDEWKSFQEACKENADLQSWDTNLKGYAEKILITLKGGEGLMLESLKPFTQYALKSNTKAVQEILAFKEDVTKRKASSKEKKINEERVNIVADEYIKNSSNMLDFLSELEKFLMDARDSHSYITSVIQKYFEGRNDMGGAEYYRVIADNLKRLRESDNTFDHSAKNLLKNLKNLKDQHESVSEKLQFEIKKLSKKEKRSKSWKNLTYMIYLTSVVGLVIAEIVTAFIAAPAIAAAFAAAIVPTAMAGEWTVSLFEESEKAYKSQWEVSEEMRKETRVSIKDSYIIKSSIDDVINQINSVMYSPSSEMNREQLDFTMKGIKSKLGAFLNKIEDLVKDVQTTKMDIRKARDTVHIRESQVRQVKKGPFSNTLFDPAFEKVPFVFACRPSWCWASLGVVILFFLILIRIKFVMLVYL